MGNMNARVGDIASDCVTVYMECLKGRKAEGDLSEFAERGFSMWMQKYECLWRVVFQMS